jgi:hypothetical protein
MGDFKCREVKNGSIDQCKPVLLELSLAGNLVKPLLSLYGAEWREYGYGHLASRLTLSGSIHRTVYIIRTFLYLAVLGIALRTACGCGRTYYFGTVQSKSLLSFFVCITAGAPKLSHVTSKYCMFVHCLTKILNNNR